MKKQITAAMIIFAMIGTPAMAQGLDNQAFAGKVFHTEAGKSMQLAELSAQEMRETEGEAAPLVAIGLMAGGRFIAQRWVTQSVARNMVRSAGNNAFRNGTLRYASGKKQVWGVMANSRSQARAIAGNTRIRELHTRKPGTHYRHYHTSTRNGAHVWYGRPTIVR